MKVTAVKNYEVIFQDEEVVAALVHWLSMVRGRTDTIELGSLIHNGAPKIFRKGKSILLRFEVPSDESEI
jgi:hypothetical protein